eukprot:CAMPEP_0118931298 /NCGR_PEP_ID=MMETSP1169-20130426/7685_1 /TAXON_ID=36882 /ORGANISM="Pyramimonas obovata, Strain CCMP722" /LENGTH=70 /DNA_ID=CAMNT_0006873779 /DNA_START=293 /DNA_END=505 /DNA_ORIENTATION=+
MTQLHIDIRSYKVVTAGSTNSALRGGAETAAVTPRLPPRLPVTSVSLGNRILRNIRAHTDPHAPTRASGG